MSDAKAAWPAAPSQVLPPNIARACRSTASPMRRSTAVGTSGARRSAAYGMPKNASARIEHTAASDQRTMRQVWRAGRVADIEGFAARDDASCVAASETSRRASGSAVAQRNRRVSGGPSARRISS